MNRRPPQPLDAEERALAARLPRPHGRSEPGPDLDARILAAARTALEPARPGTTARRRSWIAPTAVAASLLLAVGLAWQLRPPAALEASVPATTATAAADASGDALSSPAIEAAPAPAAVAVPSVDLEQRQPMPQPLEPTRVAKHEHAAVAPLAAAEITEIAAAPAPPPAPPAPAAPAAAMADEAFASTPPAAEQAATAPARAAALAKSAQTGSISRESAAAAGSASLRQQAPPARATDNATLDSTAVPRAKQAAAEPDEEVPPATADAPEVRDAWLKRIGELLKQGKHDEAKASLAEFRRRYPDVSLPTDLRKLEP